MLGNGHVLLNFIDVVVPDHSGGVLLTVDRALLHSGVELVEGHRGGQSAEILEVSDVQIVGHGTDLQALEVIRAGDGLLGVGDVTEADVAPAEVDDAELILQAGAHLFAERAVHRVVDSVNGGEEVGQADDGELGDEAGEDGVVQVRHLKVAHLHRVDVLSQGAEHTVGVDLNGDVAVGSSLKGLFEAVHQSDVGGVDLGSVLRDADGDLVGRGDLGLEGVLAGVDLRGIGVGAVVVVAAVVGLIAAGDERQSHDERKKQGYKFLHDVFSILHF